MDIKEMQDLKVEAENNIKRILDQFVMKTNLPIETVTIDYEMKETAGSKIFIDQVFKIKLGIKL